MIYPPGYIDFRYLSPITKVDLGASDNKALINDLDEAHNYIRSIPWCGQVGDVYYGPGTGIPGCFSVFLFSVMPIKPFSDDYIWIISGDIPVAYMLIEEAPTPFDVLDLYVGALEQWVGYILSGSSPPAEWKAPPIKWQTTRENAEMLNSRLELISKFIDENQVRVRVERTGT